VAQLAGLPRPVIRRAQELLRELEHGERVQAPQARKEASPQLSLFIERDPVLDALKALDMNSLSPLEALMKLYELQKLARGGS
jgi:DNA mismatch repair protein MutS